MPPTSRSRYLFSLGLKDAQGRWDERQAAAGATSWSRGGRRTICGIRRNIVRASSAVKTLLGVLLLALGCTPIQPQPTPAYDCSTVCAHGREMGCDWAAWTPLSTAATCQAAEGCTTSELRFNVK